MATKSTTETISIKRREITEREIIGKTGVTGAESKKRLLFNVEKSTFSTASAAGMNALASNECFSTDMEFTSKSPPHKQQRVNAWPDKSANSREGIATLTVNSSDQYKSPLDLLIQDMQVEVEKESKKVTELQRELERLSADYGKHVGVDYTRPASTNCHRREGHNRVNCP